MVIIKNHVWNMVNKFSTSHFTLAVASHMHYDDDVVFNENNVTLYLSELEEYISNFITYLAQRDRNPEAPIAGLSLENMANKEFDKGAVNIEAPIPLDFQNLGAGDETTMTDGDDYVINPKDLFRKFDEITDGGKNMPTGINTMHGRSK